MWHECGIKLSGESGPISMNFGHCPVRLNPHEDGEVVWGTRIDPIRTLLRNIPLPESGFRYEDIVLHDGASVGSRISQGREYGVFNVLEIFEPSQWSTYCAVIDAPGMEAVTVLGKLAEQSEMGFEDWTDSIRPLCRECSESSVHEHAEQASNWSPRRRIGLSAKESTQIDDLLRTWTDRQCGHVEEVALKLQA
jgi:hypothetical protein